MLLFFLEVKYWTTTTFCSQKILLEVNGKAVFFKELKMNNIQLFGFFFERKITVLRIFHLELSILKPHNFSVKKISVSPWREMLKKTAKNK
jgi:hypothetical protein